MNKKWQYRWLGIIAFLGLMMLLTGCSHKEKQQDQNQQIVTATIQPNETKLYYSGSINPLHVDNVVSPVDGIIDKLYFRYGDDVNEGQLLMSISSSKAQDDYRNALTDYIGKKSDFLSKKNSFAGTQMLYKLKIVDEEDYQNEKSQLESSQLAYINAANALEKTAKNVPGAETDLEKLSLEDIPVIKAILEKQFGNLKIYATADGIALFSTKSSSGDDTSGDKAASEGSEVKQGQVLVSIGHLVGLSTVVYVNQNEVNKIKPGQPIIITSSALPGTVFHGIVKDIAAQARTDSGGDGGGLATFAVTVVVPKTTDQERKLIRVGMDAKVEITIKGEPQIRLPINAVFEKNGVSMVTMLDANGKPQDVPVQTGQTDMTSVAILSGIKPGDKVVVHD